MALTTGNARSLVDPRLIEGKRRVGMEEKDPANWPAGDGKKKKRATQQKASQVCIWNGKKDPNKFGSSELVAGDAGPIGNNLLCLISLWLLALLNWLYNAYLLEFCGVNTFLRIWIASIFFFIVNIIILIALLHAFQKPR